MKQNGTGWCRSVQAAGLLLFAARRGHLRGDCTCVIYSDLSWVSQLIISQCFVATPWDYILQIMQIEAHHHLCPPMPSAIGLAPLRSRAQPSFITRGKLHGNYALRRSLDVVFDSYLVLHEQRSLRAVPSLVSAHAVSSSSAAASSTGDFTTYYSRASSVPGRCVLISLEIPSADMASTSATTTVRRWRTMFPDEHAPCECTRARTHPHHLTFISLRCDHAMWCRLQTWRGRGLLAAARE